MKPRGSFLSVTGDQRQPLAVVRLASRGGVIRANFLPSLARLANVFTEHFELPYVRVYRMVCTEQARSTHGHKRGRTEDEDDFPCLAESIRR